MSSLIEKATNEKNTTDQWSVIMDICDKISFASSASVKESLRIIIRRLNHQDPHVVMQAITVSQLNNIQFIKTSS